MTLQYLLNPCSYFVVPVRGYDRCWIFGDIFASRSFEQHFKARKSMDYNNYLKAHFDVSGYFNHFTSDNPSILGRVASLLNSAANVTFNNALLPLPKIIIMVLDDDIIKLISEEDNIKGFSKPCTRLLNFLMTEFDCGISTFKELLPVKCIKPKWPQFLWIQVPEHINFKNNALRFKFNWCLEETTKLHSNCAMLMLKKVWNPDDINFYYNDRFTQDGYRAYWEAIDRTMRYFDSVLLRKREKMKHMKLTNVSNGQKGRSDQKDRFQWQNPKVNASANRDAETRNFRTLPSPPPTTKRIC